MSESGNESDHLTGSQEDLRAESFYSVESTLPKESVSCLSVLLEYDQEGLEKTFSEMDIEDPVTGEGSGSGAQVSGPWGKVSQEQQDEYKRLLSMYNVPRSETPNTGAEEDDEDRSNGTPPLPPTSPSSSAGGSDRPLSPFLYSDEEYVEYVEVFVPEALQDVALRTPLMSLLRDIVRAMVNAKNEPLYSLQKYDPKEGTVKLARIGHLYTHGPNGTPTPVIDLRESPKAKKKMPRSSPRSGLSPSALKETKAIDFDVGSEQDKSGIENETISAQMDEVDEIINELWPPLERQTTNIDLTEVVPIRRAVSPRSSHHYSQTSTTDSSSEEEEEVEVMQQSYSFMCPIFGSTDMSVKVFPGYEVEPLIRAGMDPPEIFKTVLRDRGLLRALEAVLDIAQTHMT